MRINLRLPQNYFFFTPKLILLPQMKNHPKIIFIYPKIFIFYPKNILFFTPKMQVQEIRTMIITFYIIFYIIFTL